jgi:hypothetical protein
MNKFSQTLEQKYPIHGPIGSKGEKDVNILFKKAGSKTVHHPRSFKHQVPGNDLEIDSTKVDVKTNIQPNGNFAIEVGGKGWLLSKTKKSPYIIHYNRFDEKTMIVYPRKDMQIFILTGLLNNTLRIVKDKKGNDLTWMSIKNLPDFVTILN